MSINEKMALMLQGKSDIRQAIVNKGIDMTNVPFTEYASKIDEITSGTLCFGGGSNYSGTSSVIDFKKATKIQGFSISGGSPSQHYCNVTLQGSNDNSTWINDKTYQIQHYGNCVVKKGTSNSSYRYWRVKHEITQSAKNAKDFTIIMKVNEANLDLHGENIGDF